MQYIHATTQMNRIVIAWGHVMKGELIMQELGKTHHDQHFEALFFSSYTKLKHVLETLNRYCDTAIVPD